MNSRQVCTRINRLLDLNKAFNPFLVFQREIEKQDDIMFKVSFFKAETTRSRLLFA